MKIRCFLIKLTSLILCLVTFMSILCCCNNEVTIDDPTVPEPKPKNEKIKVERIDFMQPISDCHAVITAYDSNNNTLWQYETPEYEAAQLSLVSEIGKKDDIYLFVENGSIIALDVYTGEIAWENKEFGGAGASFVLGENAVYLCGYFGPDFFAVSYEGKTLKKIEKFNENYSWAFDIQIEDNSAVVSLEGGASGGRDIKKFFVDLKTYKVTEELNFAETMVQSYGSSSQKQFVSCEGADVMKYPDDINGYLSHSYADLDNDGTNEIIALRVKTESSEAQIIAEIYTDAKKGFELKSSASIYAAEYCRSAHVYSFYSEKLKKNCIVVDSASGGAYTGYDSDQLKVFTLSLDSIKAYGEWEYVYGIPKAQDDIEAAINETGVPYTKYCANVDDTAYTASYYPLCETEHEVAGDGMTYLSSVHKLCIKAL